MPVPSMGWFATCKDPHGNDFGLWQNDPSAPDPSGTRAERPPGLQLGKATLEELALDRVRGELDGSPGRGPGLTASDPAQQIGSGPVVGPVAVEALDPVDQCQAVLGPWAIATATARFNLTTGEGETW